MRAEEILSPKFFESVLRDREREDGPDGTFWVLSNDCNGGVFWAALVWAGLSEYSEPSYGGDWNVKCEKGERYLERMEDGERFPVPDWVVYLEKFGTKREWLEGNVFQAEFYPEVPESLRVVYRETEAEIYELPNWIVREFWEGAKRKYGLKVE